MRRWPVPLFIVLMAILVVPVAKAQAAVTYLRPNADISLTTWTVVGASTAWSALSDPVTETETPSHTAYLSNSTFEGIAKVGLESTGLAGATSLSAAAWFYTPTTQPVRMTVIDASERGSTLASKSFTGSGWHSVALQLSGSQAQLDNLQLAFSPVFERGSPSSHQVDAAFIRLNQSLSAPKVYWGARMDGDVALMEGFPLSRGDAPWDQETWNLFQEHTGNKSVSIVAFGQPAPWKESPSFVVAPYNYTTERKAIPLVSMDSEEVGFPALEKGGSKEEALRTWAKEAKAYGKPFFFRWDWEMNGEWFKWGELARHEPEDFIKAWQNFHNIAVEEGATNITWVWCPNVNTSVTFPIKSLYPGDSYVDWLCLDGYNHGTNPLGSSGWTSFAGVFGATYEELAAWKPEKPIMIGETASTESGGSKPEWIEEALGSSIPNTFPKIKAFVWFNWNIEEGGGRWDWPIESSTTSREAFASSIASPFYANGSYGSLPPLTKVQPLP